MTSNSSLQRHVNRCQHAARKLKLFGKVPWLTLARAVLLAIAYITYVTLKPIQKPFGKPLLCSTNTTKYDGLHLVILLRGEKPIERARTMLKSIFYHNRKFDHNDKECSKFIDSAVSCPNMSSSHLKRMYLHILGDNISIPMMQKIWSEWIFEDLGIRYYLVDEQIEKLSHIRNFHSAGVTPLLKLVMTSVLPEEVKNVLILDSDILLNANIEELWRHFDFFRGCQAIGFAWEHFPLICNPFGSNPIPIYGINSGVILARLDILRQISFEERWNYLLNRTMRTTGYINLGDQEIFSDVINEWPELYYELPCEWNVQVFFDHGTYCCLTTWPIRNPGESNCFPLAHRVAKLIHYNMSPKPRGTPKYKWTYPRNHSHYLTVPEIRTRFAEAYYFFKSIPTRCFR